MKRRFKCFENNYCKITGKVRGSETGNYDIIERDSEIIGREGSTPMASFCTLRVKEIKCKGQDKQDGRRSKEFKGLSTYSSLQITKLAKEEKMKSKMKKKSVTEIEKVFQEMSEKLCGHMREDVLGPSLGPLPWSANGARAKSEKNGIVKNQDWEDSLVTIVEKTVRDSLCLVFDNYMKETIEKYIKYCVECIFRQFPVEMTAGMMSGLTADATVDTMVDATTDVMSAITADIAADVAADMAADVAPDMAADVAADIMAADVAADIMAADVATDMAADVAADMAAMTNNTTVYIASEITPITTQSLHDFVNLHVPIKSSEVEESKESDKSLLSGAKEISTVKSTLQQNKFTTKTVNDVKKRYKEVRAWPKRKEFGKPVSAPPRVHKK